MLSRHATRILAYYLGHRIIEQARVRNPSLPPLDVPLPFSVPERFSKTSDSLCSGYDETCSLGMQGAAGLDGDASCARGENPRCTQAKPRRELLSVNLHYCRQP